MKYDIIYADPPWRNPKSGTNARNNEKHYPSMSTEEICNLDGVAARYPAHCADTTDGIDNLKFEKVTRRPPEGEEDT